MENEWKELQIDNLPGDILVGDYEWQIRVRVPVLGGEIPGLWAGCEMPELCHSMLNENKMYRYRPRQPEPPTHEEIVRKWWKTEKNTWAKVVGYFVVEKTYNIQGVWVGRSWFTNRQSADCPEER